MKWNDNVGKWREMKAEDNDNDNNNNNENDMKIICIIIDILVLKENDEMMKNNNVWKW